MKLLVSVKSSEKFTFNGHNYVRITGLVNDRQICSISCREEMIPDALEGKVLEATYDIGFDSKYKPYLKLIKMNLGE